MGQKLSAMTYIKNNKRKVSVLIVSMAMCLVLFYLTQFLLGVSTETFRVILQEQREKVQFVWLPSYAFEEDFSQMSDNEYWQWQYQAHEELSEEMKKIEGVK
ncbi:MAG: hypothetical protein IJ326_06455, partial [Lachnospiraceae bacterium]|nr:hypothetical protein [Lachnospiraceae bacterium]